MIMTPGVRKLALTVHLTCSVGWIGAAVAYLALGVAADVYVVFIKITHSTTITIAASIVLLLVMLSLWFLYPLWLRARQ